MKELENISIAFPESTIDRTKFFQDYFKDDRRNMNDDLYPLARNYGNWPYRENEIAMKDYFGHLFTAEINFQLSMIGLVGGSGSGKSFTLDTQAAILNKITKLKSEYMKPNQDPKTKEALTSKIEELFAIFGVHYKEMGKNDEKINSHFIALNISFNGNTNSGFVADLNGKSDIEKEKIFNREVALRILFTLFQKRIGYEEVIIKFNTFYDKMKGLDLKIEDALKIMIEDSFEQDPSIKDKNTIIVIGIDEISKLKADSEKMRSMICRASDQFYKVYTNNLGIKFDKLQVRTVFTSFLPDQILPATLSHRSILYAYLEPLSQKTVQELMGKYYHIAGIRAAINCCIGHQRSLEELFKLLKESEGKENWFESSGEITDIGSVQFKIFEQIIHKLCERLMIYSENVSWELLEPSLTGRNIIPFKIIEIEKDGKLEEQFKYEYPTIYGEKFEKPYSRLFSDGIYVNTLSRESIGEKVVPQTTLFWLHLWNKKQPDVVPKTKSENEKLKRVVFVRENEKDLIMRYLNHLLVPISWDPLRYEVYSPILFAFKLELARCRTNEISLYDFFNGSLRWNPQSIDPRDIIIQFSNSPISLSSCDSHFSTIIGRKPSSLEIGKVIDFKGTNPGFDHIVPLKCQIRNSQFQIIQQIEYKDPKTAKPNEIQYLDKTILVTKQAKYHSIHLNQIENLSRVRESFTKTMDELKKPYTEEGNKIPRDTKKKFEDMVKILIFDSLRRTGLDKGKHQKLLAGMEDGKYELKEEKNSDGDLILYKYTKTNEKQKAKKVKKIVEEMGNDGKMVKYRVDTIDSLDILEDKYLPKGVYVITDNEKAYGPTLSINKMGKCLQDGKEEEKDDNQNN